jgi:hypothetical protein
MGTTVLLALAADYFVTPALLMAVFGRRRETVGEGL